MNCHFWVCIKDSRGRCSGGCSYVFSGSCEQLRASEELDLSDNTKSGPGHGGPESGEMLYLPILSEIGVADIRGYSLGFGEVPDPHVFIEGIFLGRAHQIQSSGI